MSMTIKADLWCDICSHWETFEVGSKDNRVSILKVRATAKKKGWRAKKHNKEIIDICPKCLESCSKAVFAVEIIENK